MKKILALFCTLSLSACVAQSSEERAFDNRRYMLGEDDAAIEEQGTVLGYFGKDNSSNAEYEYDPNYSSPEPQEQEKQPLTYDTYLNDPYAEKAPVTRVSSQDLPRYQVVERVEPNDPMSPIPLETSSAELGSEAVLYERSSQPIAVQGINVPPKQTRHVRYKEIQERPRDYKKYKDVYVLDTPRGIVNLWEETVSPEVYEVVATRITNRMLVETEDLYSGVLRPSIYVAEIQSIDGDFDNGFYLSRKIIQNLLIGTKHYKVANSKSVADYYLELMVFKHDVEYGMDKILEFKMTMYDKNNKKVQEFSELIKQVKNDDRSWW